jgi:hypothetical protein
MFVHVSSLNIYPVLCFIGPWNRDRNEVRYVKIIVEKKSDFSNFCCPKPKPHRHAFYFGGKVFKLSQF